ncbi:Rieske (2Fe-2S) protein [Acidovorax sp. A79]|uniref:Rieske (2Fe-2S) protein n=1 Tax=Acidovorax sp. A79 TaxID=3056107 RepID=UPI0034E8D792
MPQLRLCHVEELPEGSARGFGIVSPGRDRMFLVKHQGVLHGYLNDCPHWPGSPMAWRRDAYLNPDATRIVCSGHGAEFDITSGRCTLGPCLDQFLAPVDLEIDHEGIVHAYLPDTQVGPHARG